MKTISTRIKEKPWIGWIIFFISLILVFLLGLMAASIIQRRTEAVFVNRPVVKYQQWEPRSAVWGENFPQEYQSYLKTRDTTFMSMFNGNAPIDMLSRDPRLVILWAGYSFSKEYHQARGHYYSIDDVRYTLRSGAPMTPEEGPQPATCWTCKSPDVPRVMHDIGTAGFYSQKWAALGPDIINPISCADCHDALTMDLRITRPALPEAFQRMGKDITKTGYQEMRSLICAQCHSEYYFKKDGNYLTFPWDKGMTVEAMEQYYDSSGFTDWTHQLSRTPMLKAQHPDYEIFTTGIHYDRGVACPDCHMPYYSEGAQKFTDHHIQSPLNNISNSCQVCHRESEEQLTENVYERQVKVHENTEKTEDLLCRAHFEAKAAWDAGATQAEMAPVLQLIRQAQWRWDYVAASHGAAFHSPIEVLRIIGTAIDKVQEARIQLAKILYTHGITSPVVMPDISTKEKAQKILGIDLDNLIREKMIFLDKIVPEWMKKAAEREKGYAVEGLE
jgi:nitrite reductase (cytochrome c-552)